ncbi:MAG: leucine-rich repeat domain-containing protein, partial [Ruminococcus sp.]|nr:leucine-rich repeat domain-containing protein [Ruminococcus sp.]
MKTKRKQLTALLTASAMLLSGMMYLPADSLQPLSIVTAAESLPETAKLTEERFPDANFRAALAETFRLKEGDALTDEMLAITELHLNSKQISDLTGVSYFTKLEKLNCYNNQISKLDLSMLTELESLDCSDNALTQLDVSHLSELHYLDCSKNALTELDVSANVQLTSLECQSNQLTVLDVSTLEVLHLLNCRDNQLTKLDVTNCSPLWSLECDGNPLWKLDGLTDKITQLSYPEERTISSAEALDLSGYGIDPAKVTVTGGTFSNEGVLDFKSDYSSMTFAYDCGNNTSLAVTVERKMILSDKYFPDANFRSRLADILDIAEGDEFDPENVKNLDLSSADIADLTGIDYFVNLETLDCADNQLTASLKWNLKNLKQLNVSDNAFTSLVLNDMELLTSLNCAGNQITMLTIKNCPNLSILDCSGNLLTKLDLSAFNQLTELNCSGNTLTRLMLNTKKTLEKLDCSKNLLSLLDLTGYSNLIAVNCSENLISELNTKGAYKLEEIDCRSNQLHALSVEHLNNLNTLNCSDNPLGTLHFNSTLKELYCYETALTELTIPELCGLEILYCYRTPLTALDVTNAHSLKELECFETQITELNLKNNEELYRLDCSSAKLTKLDLSANKKLTALLCSNNKLTDLDVSMLYELKNLYCEQNRISVLDVTTCRSLEEIYCSNNNMTQLIGATQDTLKTVACSGNKLWIIPVLKDYAGTLVYDTVRSIPEKAGQAVDLSAYTIDRSLVSVTGGSLTGDGKLVPDEGVDVMHYTYGPCGSGGYTMNIDVVYTVTLDESYFPDAAFRAELGTLFGISEGDVLTEEMLATETLSVQKKNIADLTGICYFADLKKLTCYGNALTKIDLSYNTALTTLYIGANTLTELDVSMLPDLQSLSIGNNKISEIDLSSNTKLTSFSTAGNPISVLDLSNHPDLDSVDCGGSPCLTELKLDKAENISELIVDNTPLYYLDLTSAPWVGLSFYGTNLWGIDLHPEASLSETSVTYKANMKGVNLAAMGIDLNKVTVNGCTITEEGVLLPDPNAAESIYTYDCGNGKKLNVTIEWGVSLTEENFPDVKFRETLSEEFGIAEGDWLTPENLNITTLIFHSKGMTSIEGIEFFTKLTKLNCYGNYLTNVDLSGNPALVEVTLNSNRLHTLILDGCTSLAELYVDDNQLTALDVDSCTNLDYLTIDNNPLTELDITSNEKLRVLYVRDTPLTSLELSGCPDLDAFSCSGSGLTALDVSNNTKLTNLSVNNTGITSIDLTNCTILEEFSAANTPLWSIQGLREEMIDVTYDEPRTQYIAEFTIDIHEYIDDANKVTITGGSLDENGVITVDPDATECVYVYDCGAGYKLTVNIVVGVPLTEEYFPNQNFRALLAEKLGTSVGDLLTMKHLSTETLSLWSGNISDLTGIEYFRNLRSLNVSNNPLYRLDLSKNTKLEQLDCDFCRTLEELVLPESLVSLDCEYNNLSELDLRHLINLERLNCPDNKLTALYLPQSAALKDVKCNDNLLTALDVSANTGLTSLTCYDNNLTELLLPADSALTKLSCSSNELTALDLTKTPHLEYLSCSYNKVPELDLSQLSDLNDLYCSQNVLTALDVSSCPNLMNLYCYGNQLTTLDLSANTKLEMLECDNNQISTLDLSANTMLDTLNCKNNQISTLDLSANTMLEDLNCTNNQISTLDLSANTKLGELYCKDNPLWYIAGVSDFDELYGCEYDEERYERYIGNNIDLSAYGIDLSKVSLTGATIDENGILTVDEDAEDFVYVYHLDSEKTLTVYGDTQTEIYLTKEFFPDDMFRQKLASEFDVSEGDALTRSMITSEFLDVYHASIQDLTGIEYFSKLKRLNCGRNQLTELDLSTLTALEHLECYDNQLTTLDVSNLTALTILDCGENQLTELDLSMLTALEYLDCYDNQLTTLNVSNLTALMVLDCRENQLTELNLSTLTALMGLDCSENQLTKLDLSNLTALSGLDCSENQLTKLDLSTLTALEYLDCYNNQLTTLDVSNLVTLEELYCYENKLTTLNLSGLTALDMLDCSHNQLGVLELPTTSTPLKLYAVGNPLWKIDLPDNIDTYEYDPVRSLITDQIEIDLSDYEIDPDDVTVKNGEFKDGILRFTGSAPIEYIYDVTNGEKLTVMVTNNANILLNEVYFPDANFRAALAEILGISEGDLISIEKLLTDKLDVSKKQIADLTGISYFSALTELNAADNALTALDLTSLHALEKLNCDKNSLTVLDVSHNTDLKDLSCTNNELHVLDLSKNNALEKLNCNDNYITYLDLSNTALNGLQNVTSKIDLSGNSADLGEGFDAEKASDLVNATIEGTTLYKEECGMSAFYTYDTGNANAPVAFMLKSDAQQIKNEHIAEIADVTYDYTEIMPEVEIVINGYKLQREIDYTVEYADNINVGTATVSITGINGFEGTVNKTFEILKIKPDVEAIIPDQEYFEGDALPEISASTEENGVIKWLGDLTELVFGINILEWLFTPEDTENVESVTGVIEVEAKATTTTTTEST